ncbi:hypothetical protein [Methanobacterium ferruginis]|uniref:hypothetical protein n=1 Tax=Methanobacterium ferruginis TaxID=710191 RepID=UPI002572C4DA|nr:hypothetical protein [Methanobacterium ferruginis]BDZ68782.1 hypothetical protein GCM10025860_22300 [Methanobacterium ferruginis]
MAEDQKLQKNNIILYKGDEGAATIEVLFKEDTMWSTQKTMATLFDVDRTVITKHLKNVFSEGSYMKSQLVQNLHILPVMGKNIKQSIMILMQS